MLAHPSLSRVSSAKAARAQAAADAQRWEEEAAQFEEERCQSLCPLRLQYTRELMRELDIAAAAARTESEGAQAQRSALKGCLSDGECQLLLWDLPRGYRTLLMRGLDNSKHEPPLAVVGNLNGVLALIERDGHVCTHRDERGQTILHYCARVLSDNSSPALPHAFRHFTLLLLQLLFKRCDAARVVNWLDAEGMSAVSLLLTSLTASFASKVDYTKPSPVIEAFMLMRKHGMAVHDVSLASGRSLFGALIDHVQVQWMLRWLSAESDDELYVIIAREAGGLESALAEANVNAAAHPHSTPHRLLATILHTLQQWYAGNHPSAFALDTPTSPVTNVRASLNRMLRDAPANLAGSLAVSLLTHDKNTSSYDLVALLQPGLVAPDRDCMLSLAERAPGAEYNLLTHMCIELHSWRGLEPYTERIKTLLKRMEAEKTVHTHDTKEISTLLARELPQRSGDVVYAVLQTLLRARDKASEVAGEVEMPVTLPHGIFEHCASSSISHDQAWTTIRLLLEHGIMKDERGEGFGHHFVRASNAARLHTWLTSYSTWSLHSDTWWPSPYTDATLMQLASNMLATSPAKDQPQALRREMVTAVLKQAQLKWKVQGMPILKQAVDAYLIPDLANIVFGYLAPPKSSPQIQAIPQQQLQWQQQQDQQQQDEEEEEENQPQGQEEEEEVEVQEEAEAVVAAHD